MTANRKTVQIILIFVGLLLILSTYFLYPKIKKSKVVENQIDKNELITKEEKQTNIFENIEYKGTYNINNPFSIEAKKAHILSDNPDLVYMKDVRATIRMTDGRVIIITSDEGKYNKLTYDCFFQKNVKASDEETSLFSENLDLLATKDSASIYNNVFLKSYNGTLSADKIDYDFETKRYKISMFDDKRVKIKLIK
tara:strand:- start:1012 stop:1599 length:588 start_codon:yes stop_codon:yes gene_type:complete